jgi:sensor c-di-GMP phosphodiesterase-like protein
VASHSFSIFDPSLDLIVRGHYENIEHIRQDWRRGSSSFNYQPKVNMRTGQVVGAAALIRW